MEGHIVLSDVQKQFGAKHVLRGLNLSVEKGRSLVVIGGSGTGKSVMLKCILGILRADGGTMAALHVIGEDFELRFLIDLGVRRQEQRARQLMTVGLLRFRSHNDAALHDSVSGACGDAFGQDAAARVGGFVHDLDGEVRVLIFARGIGAGEIERAAGAGHARLQLLARHGGGGG